MRNSNKRLMVFVSLTVASLPLLAACGTGTAGRAGDRVVATQCAVIPPPPAVLQQAPPDAVFQTRLLQIFSISPTTPTSPPSTLKPATPTP